MFRCWSAPGAIPPTAALDAVLQASGAALQLPLGEGVELESSAFVPQPGFGVGDRAQDERTREGRCPANRVLYFSHHFRRVGGCAHPIDLGDLTHGVDIDLQHTDGVQQGRQLASINSVCVLPIKVGRCSPPVIPLALGCGCLAAVLCGGNWLGLGAGTDSWRCGFSWRRGSSGCQSRWGRFLGLFRSLGRGLGRGCDRVLRRHDPHGGRRNNVRQWLRRRYRAAHENAGRQQVKAPPTGAPISKSMQQVWSPVLPKPGLLAYPPRLFLCPSITGLWRTVQFSTIHFSTQIVHQAQLHANPSWTISVE